MDDKSPFKHDLPRDLGHASGGGGGRVPPAETEVEAPAVIPDIQATTPAAPISGTFHTTIPASQASDSTSTPVTTTAAPISGTFYTDFPTSQATASSAQSSGIETTADSAAPFATLSHLKRANTSLLRQSRAPDSKERLPTSKIVDFLHQCVVTGRNIADEDARATLQSILDYWYGILLLTDRELAARLGPLVPEDYRLDAAAEPTLESFTPSESTPEVQVELEAEKQARARPNYPELVQDFSREKMSADVATQLRRLLFRLIRITGASGKIERAQLPISDEMILANPTVSRLVESLKQHKLLKLEGSSSSDHAWVLADASLLTDWPALKKVVEQRSSLRVLASGWEKSGRAPAALLQRSPLLDMAADLMDLTGSERAFLTQSQQLVSNQRRNQKIRYSITIIVLAILCLKLWMKNIELKAQKLVADIATRNAEAAAREAKDAAHVADIQRNAALEAVDAVNTRNVAIREAQEKAAANDQKQKEEMKQQLDSLHAQLTASTKAATKLKDIVTAGTTALNSVKALVANFKGRLSNDESVALAATLTALQTSLDSALAGETTARELVTTTQNLVNTTGEAQLVAQNVVPASATASTAQLPLIKVMDAHKLPITAVVFSSEGLLATAGEDNNVRLWNPSGDPFTTDIRGSDKDGVKCLAFSPDGKRLAIGSNGPTIYQYDLNTRQALPAYTGHADTITSISFHPDGLRILSSSGDKRIHVWNAQERSRVLSLPVRSVPTFAAFDPTGSKVVASLDDPDSAAFVWNQGHPDPVILKAQAPVNGARFSPDGKLVVAATPGDKMAVVWDVATGKPRAWLKHDGAVYQAVFNAQGTRIATASADNSVRVWDATTAAMTGPVGAQSATPLRTLNGHTGEVRQVAFSPAGDVILSGSADATARLWYDGERVARYTLTDHTRRITAVAFNNEGTQIATGSFDTTVRLWALPTAGPSTTPETGKSWVLYGWLDTKPKSPSDPLRLRSQSFAPATGSRNELPVKGMTVTAESLMNVRQSISLGTDKRWEQGKVVDVLPKGQPVQVLDVQYDKDASPPAVWIQFERSSKTVE